MSLLTTTILSATQPTPLAYTGRATPHHQKKKTILFFCLSWHSYLLRCGCSLSFHLSWHAPSDSNSSLLLLGGMSSNMTFPPKELEREPQNRFFLSPPPDHTFLPLTHDPPPPVLSRYRLVKSGHCECSTPTCVQNLPVAFAVVWKLLYIFCSPFLTFYGLSYFLIFLSLWFAPLMGLGFV